MDRAKYKELQDLWIDLINSIDANYEDVKGISVYPKFNVEFDHYQFNNYVFDMGENLRQETLRVFSGAESRAWRGPGRSCIHLIRKSGCRCPTSTNLVR